jgi:hypothetical protein
LVFLQGFKPILKVFTKQWNQLFLTVRSTDQTDNPEDKGSYPNDGEVRNNRDCFWCWIVNQFPIEQINTGRFSTGINIQGAALP